MVLLPIDGVVNEEPVFKTLSDVADEYHLTGSDAVPPSTTVPVPQREPGVPVGGVNPAEIVALTATRLLGQLVPASA